MWSGVFGRLSVVITCVCHAEQTHVRIDVDVGAALLLAMTCHVPGAVLGEWEHLASASSVG